MTTKNVVKKFIPKPLFNAGINTFHLSETAFATARYGFAPRGMKFIGVTGTNGKTTTSLMVLTILEAAGYKVGMSSSAFISDGSGVKLNDLPGRLTNPNPLLLHRLLRRMKNNGVEWVVLESASHALHQHRVAGITFEAGIITNLTEDHLEYHKTMDNYAAAKGILFKHTSKVGVVNRDDAWADYFLSVGIKHKVTYGQNKAANYRIIEITPKGKTTKVVLEIGGDKVTLNLKLLAPFNAYNAAAALAATVELGIDRATAIKALEGLARVPGRFDAVEAGQKFNVLIDDAHTPDAIENVLKAARASTKGKVIIITGAAGERASSRRGPIGKIASTLADTFIITDDEPHHDDPDTVLREIEAGVAKKPKAEVLTVIDRCDAMREAFKRAGANDTVVIAGMGYKHHRDGPNGAEPWDDYAVAEAILRGKVTKFEKNWAKVMHAAWPKTR